MPVFLKLLEEFFKSNCTILSIRQFNGFAHGIGIFHLTQ